MLITNVSVVIMNEHEWIQWRTQIWSKTKALDMDTSTGPPKGAAHEWKHIPWSSQGTVLMLMLMTGEIWNSEVTESAESYRELPTSLGTFTWPASSWLSCCGYLMFPLAVDFFGISKREEFYKLNCCSDGVLLQYLYLNSVSSLGQPAFSQVFAKADFMARWLIL